MNSNKSAIVETDEENLRLALKTSLEVRSFGFGFLASLFSLWKRYPRGRDAERLLSSITSEVLNRVSAVRRRDSSYPSGGFLPGRLVHALRQAIEDEIRTRIEIENTRRMQQEIDESSHDEDIFRGSAPFDIESVAQYIDAEIAAGSRVSISQGGSTIKSTTVTLMSVIEPPPENFDVRSSPDSTTANDTEINDGSTRQKLPEHGDDVVLGTLDNIPLQLKPIPAMASQYDAISVMLNEWEVLLQPIRPVKVVDVEPLKSVFQEVPKKMKSEFYDAKLKNAYELISMKINKQRAVKVIFIAKWLLERSKKRMETAEKVKCYFTKRRLIRLWKVYARQSRKLSVYCFSSVKARHTLYMLEKFTVHWKNGVKMSRTRRACNYIKLRNILKLWFLFTKSR